MAGTKGRQGRLGRDARGEGQPERQDQAGYFAQYCDKSAMSVFQEFKVFLTKTNALALAIGVIIGAASGKVVTALVGDIFMPVIGLILPKGDWREAQFVLSRATDATGKVTVNAIKYGDFLGNMVDFVAIAFVVFMVTKALLKSEPVAPPAPSQTCPFCKESNAIDATRCKACTSTLG
jgi:large conductance mechanosensitive channel